MEKHRISQGAELSLNAPQLQHHKHQLISQLLETARKTQQNAFILPLKPPVPLQI